MSEPFIVDQWLYQNLASDATLISSVGTRFYADEAPSDAFPYVQWTYLSGREVQGHNANTIFINTLYLVKAVGKTRAYGSVDPLATRLNELLHKKGSDTVAGDHIFSCVREETYRLAETESGVSYRHLGGIYRILVQKG